MARRTVGKLTPRYSFILNPYIDIRLSKCPLCDRLTHGRKFALLIHLHQWGPLVLGKTCRYCTPCELIIAHQDELEAELTSAMTKLEPGVIGNEYLVIGTMDKKAWKAGLQNDGSLAASLERVADFKRYLELKVKGGSAGLE